jgi:hypothetical protein
MLVGLPEADREAAWDEIERELRQFEGQDGFAAPTESIVSAGTKSAVTRRVLRPVASSQVRYTLRRVTRMQPYTASSALAASRIPR